MFHEHSTVGEAREEDFLLRCHFGDPPEQCWTVLKRALYHDDSGTQLAKQVASGVLYLAEGMNFDRESHPDFKDIR